jgi:hypothetical protein
MIRGVAFSKTLSSGTVGSVFEIGVQYGCVIVNWNAGAWNQHRRCHLLRLCGDHIPETGGRCFVKCAHENEIKTGLFCGAEKLR